jgi:pilus assembly protein CpaE
VPTEHRILIASHSGEACEALRDVIDAGTDFSPETRVLDGGRPDPLYGVAQRPDLLVLRIEAGSVGELEALAAYPAPERLPLIVIGDSNHPGSMRAAMRAGARDFLAEPVSREELLAAVARIAAEHRLAAPADRGKITAFVNAKGGSGATFLACNVAHLFAKTDDVKTVLLDMDVQFCGLPRYFDLRPKRSLLEALDVAGDLDGTAIDSYLTRHESGLAVLAGLPDKAVLQQDQMIDRFELVLNLLVDNYERLVVDLPRRIEPFNALVLERAEQIVIVLQQTVPSLHDGVRMYDLFTRTLGIPAESISLLVNRFRKSASVELSDIQQSFPGKTPICIPNDYRAVTESVDMGVPIYGHARRSSVARALLSLQKQLGGASAQADRGFLPRFRRTG